MWQDMYDRTAGHILISECELDGSEGDGGGCVTLPVSTHGREVLNSFRLFQSFLQESVNDQNSPCVYVTGPFSDIICVASLLILPS